MRPEGPFVAERALARHSAALLRRAAPARKPGADALAAALGKKLADATGKALAPFLAGAIPQVTCGEVRIGPCDGPDQHAAAFGFAARTDKPLIWAAIDQAVLSGLVERCFGGMGTGIAGKVTPATSLLARRIAGRLAEVLTTALGGEPLEPQGPAEAISIPGRTAHFELTVTEPARGTWEIRVALSCDIVEALGDTPDTRKPENSLRGGNPAALPWSAIALPLRAVLVDMTVPLGSVAALAPGEIIPVSVARKVPLKVGGRIVGHGDVGVFDDCAALRLTTLV